ncbi:MAG: substrate-binding domain-containing protein [Thermoguttaceae bacterium]|jgi:ABC-type sugar transport system substrate-binding protein
MYNRFILSCLLATAILLPGCRRGEAPQVGAVLLQEDQFFRAVERGMRETAERAGIAVSVENSRNSPNEEERLVRSYIVRGVKVIVISPTSREGSVRPLREAHDRGIRIVAYDTPLAADFPACYVESNQYELGRSTGKLCRQYVTEKLGSKARVAVLAYTALNPESSGQRVQGFKDQMSQVPGVEFVAQQDAWLPPEADTTTSAILRKHSDLDIIWAANEGGTAGAVTAVISAGRVGRVVVFGTDISRQLADFLLDDNNVLQAVTAQQAHQVGTLAMQAALDLLAEKPVAKTIRLPGILYARKEPEQVRAYKEQL